ILFQAGIHPLTPAKKLDEKDLKRLYKTMRKVLQQSIERGADPSRMPKTWLLPNREEGKHCPRCSGSVEKIKVAGRSSYLCPSCQQRR
ncbi:MAG: zinc finger domain-containing protein, partial [Myxococcota bacterium]